MKLHAALGAALTYTRGRVPAAGAAWTKALEIAGSLDNAEYQLRSLWGLFISHLGDDRYCVALELAQRFHTLAANRSDPNDRLIGDRLIGVSQHFLGDQPSARRHLEHMLAHYVSRARASESIRFLFDPRATARAWLARVLWLQGFPDQAMDTAESSIEDARAANHVTSLCQALAVAACPVALWTGDLTAAEHYAGMLLDHSTRHALALWQAVGLCHQRVLAVKRGDAASRLRLLRTGFEDRTLFIAAGDTAVLGEANTAFRSGFFLSEMAETLGRAGETADGFAAIDERCERTEGRWMMPELLRIKGELIRLQGADGAAATAEGHFRQALDWARRQGALSWELRAATSLARLLRNHSRSADAMALLQPIYDRFTEGFDTPDLKAAKALIDVFQ